MATIAVTEIAKSLGLSEQELFDQALITFLQEKKRQVLQLQLEILARYEVDSPQALASKIEEASVGEHPAWEDLIVAENLQARLGELNEYLADLQETGNRRSS